ncbi:MAG: LysR family transcriptional regulator [Paracoccaceae bacterium]
MPPLTWFRSFEAAARTLSTTAAADEIGLTQSAVSQQIRALETRFGIALFRRHARGLSLTDDGRKLLPKVEAALETLEVASAPYLTKEGTAHVTVAASISVIEWVISPALPQFQVANPDVSIRFVGTTWPDEFAASRADVEIRFGSEKQVGADATALLPNQLVAVKAAGVAGDVESLPLIETVGTSDGWGVWGEGRGLTGLNPTFFADSYGLALRMAADGNGVALVSSVIADHALSSGQVEQAHAFSIAGNEGYYLSVQRPTPRTTGFADWLLDQIAVAQK